ncbi:MAG TPA: diheme cytochrome c-553 [candidate division Zixibacteria bacterium]|nr:diheme cytochrome c-553 [candidate division Zixibacteria bacterium]
MSRRAQLAGLLLLATVYAGVYFVASASEPPKADKAAQIERGRHLVALGGCGDCHSPKRMSEMGPVQDSALLLSGQPASEKVPDPPAGLSMDGWVAACNGNFTAWTGPWGVSFAANITSDPKTGIGNWTTEQFISAMRTGKHRGFGRPILPPMPWQNMAALSDEDLADMLAFLKSTKPVANEVPAPIPPAQK